MRVFSVLLLLLLTTIAFAGEKFDSPAQHLRLAKDSISKKAFGSARIHLNAIPVKSKEFQQTKKLYDEIGDKGSFEARIKGEKNKELLIKNSAGERKKFASNYQNSLLDNNMDAYVTTQGKFDTTLKVKYILISRPLVHQLCAQGDYWQSLKAAGFKKVIFTDGYDKSWTITP